MSIDTQHSRPNTAADSRLLAEKLVQQTGCSGASDPEQCRIVEPEAIARLIVALRQALFPHLLPAADAQTENNVATRVSERLANAQTILTGLIGNAIAKCDQSDKSGPEKVAGEFMRTLPTIQKTLLTDVQAAFDGDPACKSLEEVVLCYPGVLAVTVYRLAHQLLILNIPLLPRMMTEWAHSETGIDIHPGAKISSYFFIDHGTGVVIGETCEIGQYVKIYQGVTLGALSFPKDESGNLVRDAKRHPTIENNVVIYANATVLGGKTVVGSESVIGSSVWLTSSVEPKTTVMMERPKLRLRSGKNTDFEPPLDFQI